MDGTGSSCTAGCPRRAVAARAQRTPERAAGPGQIVNRLLVHGEDDSHVALVRDDAPRSA